MYDCGRKQEYLGETQKQANSTQKSLTQSGFEVTVLTTASQCSPTDPINGPLCKSDKIHNWKLCKDDNRLTQYARKL